MSWSLNVPATPHDEFDAAVDAAELGARQEVDGQPAPGVAEAVAKAKAVAKELAPLINRRYVRAMLNGHVVQPGEGENWSDSVTVSLSGTSTPD
jgi:hypothetical protein